MSKNLATTTVAVAPSPATSGTTLTVATGTGSRLYDGMAVLHPTGVAPTAANAEVVSITVSGDVVALTRARESSTARTVVVGDVLTQGITAAMWDGLVSSNAGKADAGATTAALAGKAEAAHAHAQSDVTGLAAALAAKLDVTTATGTYGPGGTAGNGPLVPLPGGYTAATTQTRRAMEAVHSIAGTSSATNFAGLEVLARWPFTVPLAPTRWRLRMSTRGATGTGTDFTGVSLWVGQASLQSSGLLDMGRLTGTPVQVASSVTIPGGGDYVSPWVSSATFALDPAKFYYVSAGWTMPASGGWGVGSQLWYLAIPGVTGASAGVSGSAGVTGAITGLGSFNQPLLDIRVEYEHVGSRPCGLVLGDSLSAAFSQGPDSFPAQSWVARVARSHRMPMINASLVGASTSTFTSLAATAYQRLNLSEQNIDFAVLALGSNDLNGGASADTLAANYMALVNYVRDTIGIKHVISATTPPRAIGGTALAEQAQPGATTIKTWDAQTNGTYTLGDGYTAETVTVSGTSGTGPYTLTVGALTNQHLAGEPLSSANEQRRADWNRYVRENRYLGNALPVFDMSEALAWDQNPTRLHPRWGGSDNIHPRVAGHSALARAFPVPSW